MKKPRKRYLLKVTKHELSDYSEEHRCIGTFETVAVSIRQAWSNIRFSNDLRDWCYDDSEVKYTYEVIDIEDIDPDVPTYQTEDDFEPNGEDISLFEEREEEEKLPLYATIDGIDYILTDNGEYTEIFD